MTVISSVATRLTSTLCSRGLPEAAVLQLRDPRRAVRADDGGTVLLLGIPQVLGDSGADFGVRVFGSWLDPL